MRAARDGRQETEDEMHVAFDEPRGAVRAIGHGPVSLVIAR